MTDVINAPTDAPRTPDEPGTDEVTHLSRPAARAAALLRIALGLVYLWAFVSQSFGIAYSNRPPAPAGGPQTTATQPPPDGRWHFTVDTDRGFITSGTSASPTAGYLRANSRGPLAFIPQNLPAKANDFLWIFAIGGLGIALALGICSKAAAIGGLALNVLMWFSSFPPQNNPVLDGEHMVFGLVVVTLMYIRAGDHWGLGRWWRSHTPTALH